MKRLLLILFCLMTALTPVHAGFLTTLPPVKPLSWGYFPSLSVMIGGASVGGNCSSNDIVAGMRGTNGWQYKIGFETAGSGGFVALSHPNLWTNTVYSNTFVAFPYMFSCAGQLIPMGNVAMVRTLDGTGTTFGTSSNTQFFTLIPPPGYQIFNFQLLFISSAHTTNLNQQSSWDNADAYMSGSLGTGAEIVLCQIDHGTWSPNLPDITRNETVGAGGSTVLHFGTNNIPANVPVYQYVQVKSGTSQTNEIYTENSGWQFIGGLFCDFTQTTTLGFTGSATMSYLNHINLPYTTSHDDVAAPPNTCFFYMFGIYTNDMTTSFAVNGK